jgi:hypothetical protein
MVVTRAYVACFAQVIIVTGVAMVPWPFDWIALTLVALVIVMDLFGSFCPIFIVHNDQSAIIVT